MKSVKFVFGVFFISGILVGANCQTSQYFIDPHYTDAIEFEGWGTSLAWWPDVLGAMPEDVIDNVTQAFFSPNGLNLNIVRYTIGGTTPGNYTCGGFRPGGATEAFRDAADKPYNWTRDSRQRRILAMAKDLGVDTFEAFSNSPPHWMTKTGCSKGNEADGPIHSNFDSSQAPAFSQYIADVLHQFQSEWDITFQTYAPFNEPFGILGEGFWTGRKKEQEGCNMDPQTMVEVIKSLHQTFQERNIPTTLTVADETQVDTAVMSQDYFRSQNILNLFEKVNVHGYWDSDDVRRDVVHVGSVKDGHRIWMDEVGWGESPREDMTQGLNLANRVVKDIKLMRVSAWVYWQAMEDVGGWGLLHVPYKNASLENIRYNNGFSAFRQFSRYIQKGYILIHISNNNALAAYEEENGILVLVVVNPSNVNEPQEYLLDMFEQRNTSISIIVTRTSASEEHRSVTPDMWKMVNFRLGYNAPAESITTFQISSLSMRSPRNENLIQNGDFERLENNWTFEGRGNVSCGNARFGNCSGSIEGGGGVLRQIGVLVNQNGTLLVSAWCSTTWVNGATFSVIGSRNINKKMDVRGQVYAPYGSIIEDVREGDVFVVSFESAGGNSYVDSVDFHFAIEEYINDE